MTGRGVRRGRFETDLGRPVGEGSAVAVIGAGPAGCSAALALRRLAPAAEVLVFEYKRFEEHFNQCMGVLSPPFEEALMEATGLRLPSRLVRGRIDTYVLHGEREALPLRDELEGEVSQVVRRSELDAWLYGEVVESGVEVHTERVTHLEFRREDVVVYTDGGTYSVDAVIGAFGLDSTVRRTLRLNTAYRPPDQVDTIVTVHPVTPTPGELDSREIHTFLPAVPRVEFAAMVPKGDHVSFVVAGRGVGVKTLKEVVALPQVEAVLPAGFTVETAFRGGFPIQPARPFFGDRWVVVGDASGLMRPFKGKGINQAIRGGGLAARCLATRGLGVRAFEPLRAAFSDVIGDRRWGLLARFAVRASRHMPGGWDRLLARARGDPRLRGALFDAVAGRSTFRSILFRLAARPGLWSAFLSAGPRRAAGPSA